MLHRLIANWSDWVEALASLDDPQGDYLLRMDGRVCPLEQEVEQLRLRRQAAAAINEQTK